jgi:hypothetical protein
MSVTDADLLRELTGRAAEFRRTGEPLTVLDNGLLERTMEALRRGAAEGGLDAEFVAAVGWLFWHRYQAGAGPNDLTLARTWFQMLEVIDYSLLPAVLQLTPCQAIDQRASATELIESARAQFDAAVAADDPDGLREALAVGYAALQISPQGADDRAYVLTATALLLADAARHTGDITWLDSAVVKISAVVDETDPADLAYGAAVVHLAAIHFVRYEMSDDVHDLTAAIDWHQAALRMPLEAEFAYEAVSQLSFELLERYRRTGAAVDLDAAVTRAAQALTPSELADPELTRRRVLLADAMTERYQAELSEDDLDAAIAAYGAVREVSEPGQLSHWAAAVNLGELLTTRYDRRNDLADLDRAIDGYRDGLAPGTLLDAATCANRVLDLARQLARRFMARDDTSDRDAALAILDGLDADRLSPADLARSVSLQVTLLCDIGGRDGVARAISRLRWLSARSGGLAAAQAVQLISLLSQDALIEPTIDGIDAVLGEAADITGDLDAEQRADLTHYRSVLRRHRFAQSEDRSDIDDAVRGFDDARRAADTPEVAADMAEHLAAALDDRYDAYGAEVDLDRAVAVRREIAAISVQRRMRALANLSIMLGRRFERTVDEADLDSSLEWARQAAATARTDDEDAKAQSVLGHAYWRLAERRADPEHARRAAAALDRAVELTNPADRDDLMRRLTGLCLAWQSVSELMADRDAADRAVAAGRSAVALSEGHDIDRDGRLWLMANLANALERRATVTGNPDDVGEAVDTLRAALALGGDGRTKAAVFGNLGRILRSRAAIHHDDADLVASLAVAREAVAHSDRADVHRAAYLQNLIISLYSAYAVTPDGSTITEARGIAAELLDDPTVPDHAKADIQVLRCELLVLAHEAGEPTLAEAIAAGRDAVRHTPTTHPKWVHAAARLVKALRAQYGVTGDESDLDEAIAVGREVLAASQPTDPNYWPYNYELTQMLYERGSRTGNRSDIDQAEVIFRTSATNTAGSPMSRARSAQRWGLTAATRRDWATAASAYRISVEMLPMVAWRGLRRGDRERFLKTFQGVAGDAAACLAAEGRDDEAVELLDQGRSVLWSQQVGGRDDIGRLADRDPKLAARARRLATALEVAQKDSERPPAPRAIVPEAAWTTR